MKELTHANLTEGWVELGKEMVDLISKRLELDDVPFNRDFANKEAALLAKNIGVAALVSAKAEHAKQVANKLFTQIGVGK